MHRLTVAATFVFLIAALAASIGWLLNSPSFEPAITTLTLLTAITGLFIDRWLNERERRRQLLQALMHEVFTNLGVLKEVQAITAVTERQTPKMLPRFYNTTLAAVIASGTFATDKDARLWKLLHGWMQRSTEANIRFAATETYTLEHPASTRMFLDILRDGVALGIVREVLVDLTNHLFEAYAKESGIDKTTIMFASSDEKTGAD